MFDFSKKLPKFLKFLLKNNLDLLESEIIEISSEVSKITTTGTYESLENLKSLHKKILEIKQKNIAKKLTNKTTQFSDLPTEKIFNVKTNQKTSFLRNLSELKPSPIIKQTTEIPYANINEKDSSTNFKRTKGSSFKEDFDKMKSRRTSSFTHTKIQTEKLMNRNAGKLQSDNKIKELKISNNRKSVLGNLQRPTKSVTEKFSFEKNNFSDKKNKDCFYYKFINKQYERRYYFLL